MIVHFHDIFYPFEYLDDWLQMGRYWNECYFLHAYLQGNNEWEILLFNDYINRQFGDWIAEHMLLFRESFGSSRYMLKKTYSDDRDEDST